MDAELFNRWKGGDTAAATAVRNALRTTAERVLGSPALRLSEAPGLRLMSRDESRRRELTAQVAKEAMERGATSVEQLTVMAMLVAARRIVELAREGHPHAPGAHLPSPVAVSMALSPDTLPANVRDSSARHLETCSTCTEEVRLARAAVQEQRDLEAEALAETLAAEREAEDHAGDDQLAAALMAAAEEHEQHQPARPTPKPKSAPAKGAPARKAAGPSRPEAPARSGISFWTGVLPLAFLAGLGWYVLREKANAPAAAAASAYASLADRSVPPVGLLGDATKAAGDAVTDLERGDCRTAAAHLRTARRRTPEQARLWLAEGAAFVCAGDAASALAALESVMKGVSGRPPETAWYLAQAALLSGDPARALEALDVAAAAEPRRKKAIQALEQQIRAVK